MKFDYFIKSVWFVALYSFIIALKIKRAYLKHDFFVFHHFNLNKITTFRIKTIT